MRRQIKNPFKLNRQWIPSLSEIHEYTQDLQRITTLRDKCQDKDERQRYSDCIKVMQEVLIYLNTRPKRYQQPTTTH